MHAGCLEEPSDLQTLQNDLTKAALIRRSGKCPMANDIIIQQNTCSPVSNNLEREAVA